MNTENIPSQQEKQFSRKENGHFEAPICSVVKQDIEKSKFVDEEGTFMGLYLDLERNEHRIIEVKNIEDEINANTEFTLKILRKRLKEAK